MPKSIQDSSLMKRNRFAEARGRGKKDNRDYIVNPPEKWLEVYHDLMTGLRAAEVAKKHGITPPTVLRIRKRINEHLVVHYMDDIREMKAEHTQRLWHLYHEAVAAWERSKLPTKTVTMRPGATTSEQRRRGIVPPREAHVTTTTSAGNVQFLHQSAAIMNQIRDIWGANAAIRIEHSGELRVAGKTQEEANAELIAYGQSLIEKLSQSSTN